MKQIFNYRKATVLDIESDGLLDEASKIYIVGFQMHNHKDVKVFWGDTQEDRIKALFQWHVDNQIPVVAHNGISYDIPLIEKLYGMDLSNLMVIDTIGLSWYLNILHNKHSLEALAEDYDVGSKFEVDSGDWVNLTKEQAINRVTSDVVINKAVYDDFVCRLEDMYSLSKEKIDDNLVGGKRVSPDEEIYIDRLKGLSLEEHVNRILTFLMFKKDCQRLQEKTKWHVDVPYLQENIDRLEKMVEKSAKELEAIMPPVPVYVTRKEPKNRYKKNGEPSVAGQRWLDVLQGLKENKEDEWGNPLYKVDNPVEVKELTKYNPPNINGHQQVKDFLTSHGWEPETFKIIKDKEANNEWFASRPKEGSPRSEWNKWKNSRPEERAVPQIRVDGKEGKELCESVSKLADKVPEIRVLEEYSVMKHRLDTMKGIMARVKGGKIEASCHGWTNTLRLQHSAPAVNLPGAKRKYAEPIRGCLIAPEGYISVGSDLSSLESRIGHHFMIVHDPDYVATMLEEDYDGHLLTALAAGLITEQDVANYKSGNKEPRVAAARQQGKTASYACAYGSGPETVAKGANVELHIGKLLHEGYWKLNWSVKAVADEQVVVTDSIGNYWLINPINGYLYSVRSEKDYFSTLCQGTGAFFFDMWIDGILRRQEEDWRGKSLTAQFHDECVFVFRDKEVFRDMLYKMIKDSINEVNETFLLRRELDCDCQYGKRYSDIH